MTALKDTIGRAIDRLGDDLEKLSRQIHDNPELGYQEVKAAGWLTDFLAEQGFKVERALAGLETAFRATIETGEGPTIPILCEYGALRRCTHTPRSACSAGRHASTHEFPASSPPAARRRISSRSSRPPPSTSARSPSTTCGSSIIA